MKPKTIIILAIVAVFVGFILFYPEGQKAPQQGTITGGLAENIPAPDITVFDAKGAQTKLSSLKGKVVVVNFWATWCPPCQKELPSLNALAKKHMAREDFIILPILYKDELQAGVSYLNDKGIALSPYKDSPDMDAAMAYGVTGVPETYIIDKKGVLRKKIIGPAEFDTEAALGFFDKLLAE